MKTITKTRGKITKENKYVLLVLTATTIIAVVLNLIGVIGKH